MAIEEIKDIYIVPSVIKKHKTETDEEKKQKKQKKDEEKDENSKKKSGRIDIKI